MKLRAGMAVGTLAVLTLTGAGYETTADSAQTSLENYEGTQGYSHILKYSITNTDPQQRLPHAAEKEARSLAPILEELATLQDGWYGPDSRAIPRSVLNRIQHLFDLDQRIESFVRVGPYGDGTVVLEWRPSNVNYTAEFMRDGTIYYVEDNIDTDALYEEDLPNVDSLYRLLQGQLT